MVAEVKQTKARSGWPARRTLGALGISPTSYYRWLRADAWSRKEDAEPVRPSQAYETLSEEKKVVREYALDHPEIRHRELSWRMIDEDVTYLSASTVYRILKEENLIGPWRGRKKRYREESEKACRPDQVWGTDIMHLKIGDWKYYYVGFIDEYSRYLVHYELLGDMGGAAVALAAQRALETLPHDRDGNLAVRPDIRSDNGSGYVSREFHGLLAHHELTHHRITPYCPEENGIMERSNRTLREALEGEELTSRYQAEETLSRIIDHYNHERLHSALGYLRPVDYYRGRPEQMHAARRHKLSQARHRRRQINLGIRQRTLPMESSEIVPSD